MKEPFTDGHHVPSEQDTLSYMQSMLRQLRLRAAADRHDMLAYLIEMAYVEASDLVRRQHSKRAGSWISECFPSLPIN